MYNKYYKMTELNKKYEEIEKVLIRLSNTLDTSTIKQNDMYNGAYIYTLNRYRNLLLNEVQRYNVHNNMIIMIMMMMINLI